MNLNQILNSTNPEQSELKFICAKFSIRINPNKSQDEMIGIENMVQTNLSLESFKIKSRIEFQFETFARTIPVDENSIRNLEKSYSSQSEVKNKIQNQISLIHSEVNFF